MSWADWITSLTGYDGVNMGAICGYDGSVWAKSDNFTATPQELQALASGIAKVNAGDFPSFTLCGVKFMTLRLMEKELDGRKGPSSVTAMGCTQCFVVGGCMNSEAGGGEQLAVAGSGQKVNLAVSKIRDHLAASGY